MRNGAQGCHVEGTVMRGAILSYDTGPVEAEHNRQIEDGGIVNDVIVGSLSKSTVDIAEWHQAILRHACGERYSMSFCYTYVKSALGHRFHHDIHGTPRRHSRCNSDNFRILLRKFEQGFTKHILKLLWCVGSIIRYPLARFRVKFSRCMPHGGTLLCRLIALSLDSMKMKNLWTAHVLNLVQDAHQLHHLMTIIRTKVADIHTLEDILLSSQCSLQCIVKTQDALLSCIREIAFGVQPL